MPLRILFLGENWYGSSARACSDALRRLGCVVQDVDSQTIWPDWRRLSNRGIRRLMAPALIREYNDRVLRLAREFRPDVLLAFKGWYLRGETLRRLRAEHVHLYNYYPDRMVLALGSLMEETVPEYDCFFDTKQYWDGDTSQRIKVREKVFLPHGYDAQIFRPIELDERDRQQYTHDVLVVATHTARKERILAELVEREPDLDLKIYGNGWAGVQTPTLKRRIVGIALEGDSYARAMQAARINVAIMGVREGALDETTIRTFEIPACGGFMIHEHSNELGELYKIDEEVVSFKSAEELASKIRFYLGANGQRERIAQAGYKRCVPSYSYEKRMESLLAWHDNHFGAKARPS